MLQFFLKDNGYNVTIADNGIDGITKLHEGDFALVLLDILLPKIEGYAVCIDSTTFS